MVLPFVNYLSAQTFSAGFYVGGTMTGIQGLEANNANSFEHVGLTVAGTVSAKISPKTRLQMEIRFFQRGASQSPRYDSMANQYNQYFKLTMNYADIVLGIRHQIHFNIRNEAKDMYGIEAGASVGYLMGYTYEVQSITYKLAVNAIDVSPYIGIYYNVTPHFYVEGRFSNSINSALVQNNVKNPYFLYYSSFNDGHNMCFSLTLGFAFWSKFQNR
jgi:Outer membrane protein beta-barrel domain